MSRSQRLIYLADSYSPSIYTYVLYVPLWLYSEEYDKDNNKHKNHNKLNCWSALKVTTVRIRLSLYVSAVHPTYTVYTRLYEVYKELPPLLIPFWDYKVEAVKFFFHTGTRLRRDFASRGGREISCIARRVLGSVKRSPNLQRFGNKPMSTCPLWIK